MWAPYRIMNFETYVVGFLDSSDTPDVGCLVLEFRFITRADLHQLPAQGLPKKKKSEIFIDRKVS